jgi:hypothetical protein
VWLSNPGATGEASLETLADVLKKLDALEPLPPETPAPATKKRPRKTSTKT